MLKFVPFEFNEHINFILDSFEEAAPYSWPGVKRIEQAREMDYEFFKYMNPNENVVSMLVKKDEVIGFVWCNIKFNKIEERKYCHINFVYLIPKFRGKKHGKYLMDKIEQIAKDNQSSVISLEVTESNRPAVKLYEKEGYKTKRYIMQKEL